MSCFFTSQREVMSALRRSSGPSCGSSRALKAWRHSWKVRHLAHILEIFTVPHVSLISCSSHDRWIGRRDCTDCKPASSSPSECDVLMTAQHVTDMGPGCTTVWLTDRQFDWLTDRQTEWRTDSLTSWQADRSTNWLTDWQFDWLTDYLADWYLKALCYRLLSTCRAAGQERNKGWRRLDSNGGERGGDRPLPKLRMFVQTARYLDEECHRVRRQQVTHWARHALNITLLQ